MHVGVLCVIKNMMVRKHVLYVGSMQEIFSQPGIRMGQSPHSIIAKCEGGFVYMYRL